MRILLVTFLTALIAVCFGQTSWQLQKDEQGIRVFTAENPTSPVKAVRVEVEFNEPIEKISGIIMNVAAFPEWIYGCIESTVMLKQSDTLVIYRHVTDAPWPFDDRDQISRFTRTVDKTTGTVTISAASQKGFPERDGFVRITQSSATWVLIPQKNGTVKTVYNLTFDPGGNIPAWMINVFITDGPFETFVNLKEKLKNK